jgi:hypothetical protein
MTRTTWLVLALCAVLTAAPAQGTPTRQVSVDYSNPLGAFDPYIFGTMAAPYYDAAGYPLTQAAGFKMVEVGMTIPVPANPNDPAQYDFSALDQQVSAVLGIGAEPMIVFSRSSKPADLNAYATYAQNIAKHLTQGWGNGYFWNVKLFRFANEPDNAAYWTGTQTEFFQTYAVWALAMKAANPAFILDAPALMNAHGTTGPNSLSTWVTGFLSYCQTNGVPVDYFSIHAYAPVPYFSFYDNFRLVQAELQNYPTLSPLYGTPRLANDEWNTLVGDLWSGSYHSQFDTAWVAAHNITALINMVEQGLQLSIRYGGTFNGGTGGCHDFLLTDCNGQGKPAYYAFKGFNWLSGSTRLSTTGTDHMNFAAMAGKGADEVTVVLSNYDVATYLNQYETAGSPAWTTYNTYVSLYGTPAVYDSFDLALTNLPWTASDTLTYERYVVDDQQQLALVESQLVSGNSALTFAEVMPAPSVQVVRLYRSGASSAELLTGKRLSMTDKEGNPARRRLVLVSTDSSITAASPGSGGDPTSGGGVLEVLNPTTGETDTFALPATSWKGLGTPSGSKGYRYTDRALAAGPCKTAKIKDGKLDARCQGAQISFSLGEPAQGSLGVRLTLGNGNRYCLSFGGTVVKDEPGAFRAKDAPAPSACP